MAITDYAPGLHATYTNIPTAHEIPLFVDWARKLNKGLGRTPLLDAIGFGEELDQRTVRFGQSYELEIDARLGADTVATGSTITLASGHGKRYKKFDVLGLFTNEAALQPVEISIIGSISGDTVTFSQRGAGGTTPSVVTAATGIVRFLGSSEPQNDFHVLSPTRRGDDNWNAFQRFVEGAGADKAYQNTPTREIGTNPLLHDFEVATDRAKKGLERALWYNRRQAETPGTPNGLLGGFDQFIVSNVINAGGAALGTRVLGDLLRDMWYSVDESMAKTFVMSYDTKRLIDATLNPIRRATMTDTALTGTVESIQMTDGSTFAIKHFRDCPNGVIYLLDFSEMKVHPYKGLDWHPSDKEGNVHGADHDSKYISGDFTLVVRNEATMAKLYNFDTNLDNYPVLAATTP